MTATARSSASSNFVSRELDETWWCRCIALSDATSRIRKFSKFCVHVKLAEVDQTFTAKDLGRGVIDTCSTGSISGTGTGTGTGIYIDLYRIPVLYRNNTCRIQ